jgi:hypothetical protein
MAVQYRYLSYVASVRGETVENTAIQMGVHFRKLYIKKRFQL